MVEMEIRQLSCVYKIHPPEPSAILVNNPKPGNEAGEFRHTLGEAISATRVLPGLHLQADSHHHANIPRACKT